MAKPRANLRLFVAIHPPPAIAKAMLGLLEGLKLPPHRRTPLEQVHMTMQFIGDTPTRVLEKTIESVACSVAGLSHFQLQVTGFVRLPERGPARLIAARTDQPATLMEIQHRLATRLARKTRPKPGDRFLPHLTLCRFRSPARMEVHDIAPTMEAFTVEQVRLMRSTLHSDGARHHEVKAFELKN